MSGSTEADESGSGPAVDLAFVLTRSDSPPEFAAIIDNARTLGQRLAHAGGDGSTLSFDIDGGGALWVTFIPVPYPDTAHESHSLLAPTAEQLLTADAHVIVAATNLPGSVRDRDAALLRLTAAVLRSTSAVAAMPSPDVGLLHAPLFDNLAAQALDADSIPALLAVGLSVTTAASGRTAVLTRGLARHEREELLVTTTAVASDALDFACAIADWLLCNPTEGLPTGDTVGRSADERVTVARVAHPDDPTRTVVHLDLTP